MRQMFTFSPRQIIKISIDSNVLFIYLFFKLILRGQKWARPHPDMECLCILGINALIFAPNKKWCFFLWQEGFIHCIRIKCHCIWHWMHLDETPMTKQHCWPGMRKSWIFCVHFCLDLWRGDLLRDVLCNAVFFFFNKCSIKSHLVKIIASKETAGVGKSFFFPLN